MTSDECLVLGIDCAAWTAIGTLALTLVTFGYVLLTYRLAKGAARSADAAERTLLLESMPILLPALGGVGDAGGQIAATINLTNAGRQPALNAQVWVTADGLSEGPMRVSAIPSGEMKQARLPRNVSWPDFGRVAVRVEFRDAIGSRYRVEYVKPASDISIERFVEGTWEPLVRADRRAELSFAELEVPDPLET